MPARALPKAKCDVVRHADRRLFKTRRAGEHASTLDLFQDTCKSRLIPAIVSRGHCVVSPHQIA